MLPWLKPGQSDNKKVSLKLFIFENYSTEKYSEKQKSVKNFKVWQSNSGYLIILTRIFQQLKFLNQKNQNLAKIES